MGTSHVCVLSHDGTQSDTRVVAVKGCDQQFRPGGIHAFTHSVHADVGSAFPDDREHIVDFRVAGLMELKIVADLAVSFYNLFAEMKRIDKDGVQDCNPAESVPRYSGSRGSKSPLS